MSGPTRRSPLTPHPWRFVRATQEPLPPSDLRELIRSDPNLTFYEDPGSGDHPIPGGGGVSLEPDCSEPTERFLRWWLRRLNHRGNPDRDALTGLVSRSHWERTLKQSGIDWPAVGLFDLDHFKRFNDEYGHDMGDRVLEAVGSAMRSYFTDGEGLVRYGGEEFLVLFRVSDEKARARLDDFREHLAGNVLFDDQPRSVTFSGGVARAVERDLDEAITQADVALYESKRRGRNRVTLHGPHLEDELPFYLWGVHRHLPGLSLRFTLGRAHLWIGDGNTLVRYRWSDDESRKYSLDDGPSAGIRELIPYGDEVMILDRSGEPFILRNGILDRPAAPSGVPPMVRLLGGEPLFAVGLNNQLYRFSGSRWKRWMGLPSEWDRIAQYGENCVIERDRELFLTGKEGTVKCWNVPFAVRQLEGGSGGIYCLSEEGGLYRLDPERDDFRPLQFRNAGSKITARSISVGVETSGRDRLAIRDDQSRLLLARGRPKAVAQTITIPDLPFGPDEAS